MRSPTRGLAAAAAASLLVLPALAGDWPQWRGPARDGRAAPDEPALTRLPASPRAVWKVAAGEGFASPVVARGRVFAMDAQDGKETLRALDAKDGRELWRAAVDDVFRDTQGPPAPRCTPVFADGRVYAQSCRGELLCVDARDGKRLWSANYARDFGAVFTGEKGNAPGATRHGNNGSPWVSGGTVYASAGSTNGAGVVALDAATGKVRWKSGNEVAAYAAPMLGTLAGRAQVVDFMADAVVGFAADDGTVLWRRPMKTAFARHVMTPVLLGDRVVVGSHQTALLALDVSRDAGGAFAAKEAWSCKAAAPNFSSLVASGPWLFGLGPQRDVVCVEAATGRLLWSKDGLLSTSADKAEAGFVACGGGSVLMLTDGGELVLFASDGAGFRELGHAQACGANWCNPALSGGRLYLRDGIRGPGSWICLDLASGGTSSTGP